MELDVAEVISPSVVDDPTIFPITYENTSNVENDKDEYCVSDVSDDDDDYDFNGNYRF